MAKRLSSLFSLSKDKDGTTNTLHSRDSSLALSSAPSSPRSRLQKNLTQEPGEIDIGVEPLALPPTFQESRHGIRPSSRPASRAGSADHPSSREGSVTNSRPQTPQLLNIPGQGTSTPNTGSPASTTGGKLSKKKSWIPGSKPAKKHTFEQGEQHSRAWIAGLKEHIEYDLTPLCKGEAISELWDSQGDVFVYLYPEHTGRGPACQLQSRLFEESRSLRYLFEPSISDNLQQLQLDPDLGTFRGSSLGNEHQRHSSIPEIVHPQPQIKVLYLPLELEGDYSNPDTIPQGDDLELLVLYRNLFSFLGGGALVSTPRQVSLYSIFRGIASLLRRLQYGNRDGSTWGEIPSSSFAGYCDELKLADVRHSREKTIEALVLAEQMKSWPLYTEAFAHAAGKFEDIKAIRSPKFAQISPITVNRLERAFLDIEARIANLRTKLDDFDFPSMFAGIANSQTATTAKLVRFKAWRQAFVDMRKFVLVQYKKRYGAWPPKASSKKNNFVESGLNRLLVQEMYQDFCNLYDMLANTQDMTSRTIDVQVMTEEPGTKSETIAHALRSVESEYDRATPPVMPPIPFDTPLLPSFDQSFRGASMDGTKAGGAKLKANEINEVLLGSYNREYIKPSMFVQEFMAYERRLAAGATLDQMIDNRCGQWLFLYAVLQALPMTAVDARGVNFSDSVEYFLFSAPRGGKPWMREDSNISRAWYNVKSAGQVISLPADVLDHQPEGVYRRSHCWLIANHWVQDTQHQQLQHVPTQQSYLPNDDIGSQPMPSSNDFTLSLSQQNSIQETPYELPRPPTMLFPEIQSVHHTPTQSPMLRPVTPGSAGRASGLGLPKSPSNVNLSASLEQVEAPAMRKARPESTYNPNVTFDSFLGSMETGQGAKKKKK